MWISEISLSNIRGFIDNGNTLNLARNINILVGQNNAGKSTILNAVLSLQKRSALTFMDVTLGRNNATISCRIEDYKKYAERYNLNDPNNPNYNEINTSFTRHPNSENRIIYDAGAGVTFDHLPLTEPENAIYPYLSKRKVTEYDESVNLGATNAVTGDFKFLIAKIARLCNVNHPSSQTYQEACKEIIGFPISTVASNSGQKAAYIIDSFSEIPLLAMGEGIPNLLGLIVDLCIAEDKIFLIEEPENDIHPKALKALLSLIEKKSENNQFIISTHSNIVTKYLGSVDNSKVFKISMSFNEDSKLPISGGLKKSV